MLTSAGPLTWRWREPSAVAVGAGRAALTYLNVAVTVRTRGTAQVAAGVRRYRVSRTGLLRCVLQSSRNFLISIHDKGALRPADLLRNIPHTFPLPLAQVAVFSLTLLKLR